MNHTLIIAEAACSHIGSLEFAVRMVRVAKKAGCDAVKFQAFNSSEIPNLSEKEKQLLPRYEFSEDDFKILKAVCDKEQIEFMATPFDVNSVLMLERLGVKRYKVPSGRQYDTKLVSKITETRKPIIFSTGLLTEKELLDLRLKWPTDSLLHCVTSYPLKTEDCNLNLLKSGIFDGLSDHTLSTVIPAVAVGLGAKIIEKHFTLDRDLGGPDQCVSLEPDQMVEMVKNVREVEKAMGDGYKNIQPCENEKLYRKEAK